MDFTGKNILVVGGSSGIGFSVVNLLAGRGATVYNISRTASDYWPKGVQHQAVDILADNDALTLNLPEQLHGLVYSVGSINLKPFNRLTDTDFLNDYKINVLGAVKIIRLALKQIKSAKGASIVLISSVAANTGMSFHASIASAKGAVEGLGLSLAAELAVHSIRVNLVSPSLTDTPLAQTFLNTPEKKEASAKRHPLNRFGEPGDVSAAIAFLLSSDSSWVTGQVLGIDGGLGSLKTN